MKRLILPDLLKGLAVLFMIQVHIMELFMDTAGRESLFGKLSMFLGGPFAAVVFMLVMGYFVAKNHKMPSQNAVRGIKIFILGFLLNIGLNFHLLLKIKFAAWPYNPLEYLFGVDILYLAGLSIVVLSGLKFLAKGKGWAALVLLLTIAGLTGFMNEKLMPAGTNYVLPFVAGAWRWSYFPLFPWLVYPLAGFAYAEFEGIIIPFFTRQKTMSVILTTVLAGLVLLFSRQGIDTTSHLPLYYHHTFGYFLWAIGLVLLWILALRFLMQQFPETYAGNFFCRMGKSVTLIYVIQWLIIGNISTAIFQTQGIGSFWYWFAGIFAASVLLTLLLEKVKFRLLK